MQEYIEEKEEIAMQKGKEEGKKEGREEGIKEGEMKGMKKGEKRGIEKGKEEGRKEGEMKGKIDLIKKQLNNDIISVNIAINELITMNCETKTISQITGLSEKEIQTITN